MLKFYETSRRLLIGKSSVKFSMVDDLKSKVEIQTMDFVSDLMVEKSLNLFSPIYILTTITHADPDSRKLSTTGNNNEQLNFVSVLFHVDGSQTFSSNFGVLKKFKYKKISF